MTRLNLRAALLAAEIRAHGPLPETCKDLELAAEPHPDDDLLAQHLYAEHERERERALESRQAWCGPCGGVRETTEAGCVVCAAKAVSS